MNHLFKILPFYLFILLATAWGGEKPEYAPGLGVSLNGASGLFYIPSAQGLGAGHIRAGILNGGSNLDTPYHLTLGLSPKIEIFLSHIQKYQLAETTVDETHVGTTLNILKHRRGTLSFSVESADISQISSDGEGADHELIKGSLLAEYPLGNFQTILQLGLHERSFIDEGKVRGFHMGLAASRTIRNGIQGGAEFLIDGPIPTAYQTTFALGIKAFIVKHFQLGLVYSNSFLSGESSPGFHMMGSLSTSPLSSFRLSGSSNIWLDLKNLLASFGVLDTGVPETSVLPEYYVSPRDYNLPHPPALDLLREGNATTSGEYAYPEFHRPEKIKLIEPPPLELLLKKDIEQNDE